MNTLLNEDQQKQVARQAKMLHRQRLAKHRAQKAARRNKLISVFISLSMAVILVVSSFGITDSKAFIPTPAPQVTQTQTPDMTPNPSEVVAAVATPELQRFQVPAIDTHFKAFMDYRTITATNSTQWQMQQEATTDAEGFRIWNGYYMVAMGTYYAPYCGRIFSITLSSGRVFQCVVSDIKADRDTDVKNQHRNGNVVEFIVDGEVIPNICWQMGDMSWAPDAALRGDVEAIELLSSPY